MKTDSRIDNRLWQVLNIAVFVATLIVNFLSTSLPIGGEDNATLVNRLFTGNVFFLPANYVFAIWGVIYSLLLAFIVWQSLPRQRTSPLLAAVGPWFVIGNLGNIAWIFLFQNKIWWPSMVAILLLFIPLLMIYLRIQPFRAQATTAQWICVFIAFSVYLAWVSVATIANAAAVLYITGWDAFGIAGETWAGIMMTVATVLAAAMLWRRLDVAFVLVVIWALVGIVARYTSVQLLTLVGSAGAVVLGVMALFVLAQTLRGQTALSRR